MHPYKIMLAQELNENDFETRRALCLEIQQNVVWMFWCYTAMRLIFTCVIPLTSKTFATGLNLTSFAAWTYVALSQSDGVVWNSKVWHMGSVFLWRRKRCGNCKFWSILQNAREFFEPRLNEREDQHQLWFQQDGATAHTSRNAIKTLKEMFPNHLISCVVTLAGHQDHLTWIHAIIFSGVTWNRKCTLNAHDQ